MNEKIVREFVLPETLKQDIFNIIVAASHPKFPFESINAVLRAIENLREIPQPIEVKDVNTNC